MQLRARVAILDIEGTIGSIAFVHDVLFPFASERLDGFARAHEDDPRVRALLDQTARESGVDVHDLPSILRVLHEWTDEDYKFTSLKELQGMIWREGFESGALRAELYQDAVDAMRRFRLEGVHLHVYSSGSVEAQQLLFAHSIFGDLRPLFEGYFDTTVGPKRDPASYRKIAETIGAKPASIVFFSDNVAELDAAREAAMQTVQLARPQDHVRSGNHHPALESFEGVEIVP